MTDLHDRFTAWLVNGAGDDLPRDVALHAYACPECQRHTAAFDTLSLVDLARAPLPASRASSPQPVRGAPVRRIAAGVAVVALLALAVGLGAPRLLGLGGGDPAAGDAPRNEGVLGGTPRPRPTATATASATATPTPTPEPTPAVATLAPVPTAPPPVAPPPPTAPPADTPPPPPETPAPTPPPTATPEPPTPSPTPAPAPTATPTPTPTATP